MEFDRQIAPEPDKSQVQGADPVTVTPVEQDEKILFDWQQPGWETMVKDLEQVRTDRLAQDMSFGRVELEIPVAIYHFLVKKYPDLQAPDRTVKRNAWVKFMGTALGKSLSVRGKGRFLNRSVGGLDNGG